MFSASDQLAKVTDIAKNMVVELEKADDNPDIVIGAIGVLAGAMCMTLVNRDYVKAQDCFDRITTYAKFIMLAGAPLKDD